MKEKKHVERRQAKNNEIRELVEKAQKVCFSFFPDKYKYNSAEAVLELGLDEELVDQLLEDYIAQIIKAVSQFEEMLYILQSDKDANKKLVYTNLRELAHKNLGVAKNLRIEDAIVLLDDLMRKDDLEHLFLCIEALRACAITLKPTYAYNTIKLIEVKSTF
ncbi:hypothetical protein JHD49_06980 [Sulfurimonas sp. SAG-AH-194-C21]|nr:hypothetical protein [Sulfurimonas sp. SAG-AH-194-C21]MDF1883679.1 hypothetical protein [Sulfurimonas sp. SAG-AH-194-C21]